MPENTDFGDSDYTGTQPGPDAMNKWLAGAQAYLDGKPTDYDPRQGIPPEYKVDDNGQLVKKGQWDQWGKGATEFFASAVPTIFGVPGLGPGGTAVTEGTKMGTLDSIFNMINKGGQAFTSLSDVLGGAAKSSQAQNNTNDTLSLALYNAKNNAKLNAKKFALSAPSARMRTSMAAILPKYATPAQVHWGGPGSGLRGEVPTWTGGAKSVFDAAKDPQYSQLGDQVMNDELLAQMKGGASGGNEDAASEVAPELGKTSALDDILGTSSLTTSVLGALSKFGATKRPKTPAIPDGV
jgi:hypothetical protein